MIDSKLRLANRLAKELPLLAPGGHWKAINVMDVKIRSFTEPGTQLDLEARVKELTGTQTVLSLQCRNGTRLVGTTRTTLEWTPAA
ncbi:MAG: hypothetical protein HC802_06935 [Caldilineaceae bacterium]|nr:hypothetical protein [Caldilineaceae bacterium]